MVWIQQVQDHIRVGLVTSREYDHLQDLGCLSQTLEGKRPDVDAGSGLVSVGECDCDDMVNLMVGVVLNTVHQGLIQVEYDGLVNGRSQERG